MQKKFILAGSLITLLSIGVMTGCGPKECEHEGGTASCTELAICTKCGESYGELAAHNYGSTHSHNEEQHWFECSCGEKKDVANHEFVAGEIIKEATCTEEGSQLYTCICGETKTEVIGIKDHEYAETYSYDENQHWYECSCGDKKDAEDHEFVAGEIIKEATCTEEGSQLYTCICGATKTEVIKIKDHEYPETYTYNDEQHWFECSCGDKKDAEDHEFVAGKIIKESTCSEAGLQEYNCKCGATKNVELALAAHKDENLDILCDYGCNKKIIPPYDTLISCKTANALSNAMVSISGNHYVHGEVVEVEDSKNGIFRIQDDSNETFRLKLVKDENGNSHSAFPCKIILGDVIQAYGKVGRDSNNGQNIPQMQSPVVTFIKQHDHVHGEATCLLPATCECGHTSGEPLGHGDADNDGLCDRCKFDLNNLASKLDIKTSEGMTQVDATTISWSNDVVEFIIEKNTGANLYVASATHARIYKGNNVTIKTKNSIVIKSLTIFTSATNYADTFVSELGKNGVTAVREDTNVIVKEFNLDQITFTHSGSSTRLTGIEIVYPKPVAEKEPTIVDFNTITTTQASGGDSGYTASYTTASGWVTKNAAIQVGGQNDMNPAYKVIGPDKTYKAVCLNGKVGAAGTLTSPTLKDGLSEINVDYTKMFTDTNLSVTITVTELSTGNVYTHTIAATLDKNDKYNIYSDSWKLETPVKGDYTIVFTNDCPSNLSSNKDRMTLLKVEYK